MKKFFPSTGEFSVEVSLRSNVEGFLWMRLYNRTCSADEYHYRYSTGIVGTHPTVGYTAGC